VCLFSESYCLFKDRLVSNTGYFAVSFRLPNADLTEFGPYAFQKKEHYTVDILQK